MRILVTGTAGFIGYHLAKKLIERGDDVIGVDNINDYYDVRLKFSRLKEMGISNECKTWYKPIISSIYPNYTFIRLNLEDKDHLHDIFKLYKPDRVCNLAAQAGVRYSLDNPYAYINSNIVGFINILEACRHYNIKHLVYASSSSVYGNNTKMPLSTDDNVDHPISLYAATKKSNELMAHTYSHLYRIPSTGLRFFTVYGPWGRPDMALYLFTKAILEDKPIKVFNNGDMIRDFTYIDDIVEGISKVIDNTPGVSKNKTNVASRSMTAPYKVYNIGNSRPVKLLEYIETIENQLNRHAKKIFMSIQPGDVPKTNADISDLVEDLGYIPNTHINKGIKEFIAWYLSYYK
jgi:UDP-glucuronate 4-epimerase